jgi:hypothetical protein
LPVRWVEMGAADCFRFSRRKFLEVGLSLSGVFGRPTGFE